MRKVGIVCEIRDGKAVVLLPGGTFLQIPAKGGWSPGDMIPIRPPRQKRLFALAACFVCALALGVYGTALYLHPTALISMDINPSVEFELNRFNRVIRVAPRNEQGDDMLKDIPAWNREITALISTLLTQRVKEGQNAEITFTVQTADTERETYLLNALEDVAASHCGHAKVSCFAVDQELVEQAHELNVTAGKYQYLRQLRQIAPDIDINAYSHHTIPEIKRQIGQCRRAAEGSGQCRRRHHEH